MIDEQQLDGLLKQAGVNVIGSRPKGGGVWAADFEVGPKKTQLVLVALPPGASYISLLAIPESPILDSTPIDSLPADVLRTLIKVGSEVRLAKVTYQSSVFIVTSECSTDSPTAAKLRNRIEACAILAHKIDLALAKIGTSE